MIFARGTRGGMVVKDIINAHIGKE